MLESKPTRLSISLCFQLRNFSVRDKKRMLISWTPKCICSLPGFDIEFASKQKPRNICRTEAINLLVLSNSSYQPLKKLESFAERGRFRTSLFATALPASN